MPPHTSVWSQENRKKKKKKIIYKPERSAATFGNQRTRNSSCGILTAKPISWTAKLLEIINGYLIFQNVMGHPRV